MVVHWECSKAATKAVQRVAMLAVHSVRRLVESLVEPMAEQKAATRGE